MNKTVKLCLTITLLGLSLTGCYGPFRLTKNLHGWNRDVGGKWAREGVFLLLTFIPVYQFATLGDAIIFNSVEFWTGNNPVAQVPTSRKKAYLSDGDVRTILTYSTEDHTLDVDAFKKESHIRSFRIEPLPYGGMAVRNQNGQLVLFAFSTEDGGVSVTNFNGISVARYSAKEAEKIIGKY